MARTLVRRRVTVALVAALASVGMTAATAHAVLPEGGLAQLPGLAGCLTTAGLSEDGASTCSAVPSLTAPESAIVSPDGRNLYVGSYNSSSPTLPSTMTIFSRDLAAGTVTPLPGKAGCISTDGSSAAGANTCDTARGFIGDAGDGLDLAITSDGRWAYMTAQNQTPASKGDILIFQRDPSTGALTQLAGLPGCISSDGSSQGGASTCQTDISLGSPQGISISSDDRFVYAVDYFTPYRIHVFRRNADGTLTSIQCLEQAPAAFPCGAARVAGNSQSLVISPDGTHAYSGSYSVGISAFDRDPSTGILGQLPGAAGCLSTTGNDDTGAATCTKARVLSGSYVARISPNGQTLYETASGDSGLSVFHINPDGSLTQLAGAQGCITSNGKDSDGASTCAVGRQVDNLYGAAMSPDGRTVYESNDDQLVAGVAIFSLDPATGAATQLSGLAGCVSTDGSSGGVAGVCSDGRGLSRGYGMALSPDGRFLYQANEHKQVSGVAVFARETAPTCAATSAAVPHGTPAAISLKCTDADGDPVAVSVLGPPAHGKLGTVSAGTVTYTPAASYHGVDSFTFTGSDGVNTSAPATATLTVRSKFAGSSLVSRTLVVDAHGNVKVRVRCPADAPSGSCADVMSLYSSKGKLPRSARAKKAQLLGKGRFSVKAGKTATERFRLNKAGRKLARSHRRFSARLSLKSTSGAQASARHLFKVTVKHAKKRR
jgi:6-phosphogluconolactonase (cycloisomerase 2 family)